MNRLFVIQLTDSRIEQRDYVVHPFARPCRTYLRDSREKGVAVGADDREFVRLLHGSVTRLWELWVMSV
jgi:hypothetical protein